MGKQNKGLMGAFSGGAAGAQIGGVPGALVGAVLGGVGANSTGGEAPQQVKPVDEAFMNSLANQAMGTEKTAADIKMKAAFDQTLAQQVAAARAARGVNPALLQRNVARMAQEQGAKAVGQMAEANLQNQSDARARYLQALQLNQTAERVNIANNQAAEARDSQQLGSLINSVGAIGATFATADKAKTPTETTSTENAVKDPINTQNLTLGDSTQKASQLNNAYTLGANQQVPQYGENDLVVTSDERQKDLIKNETLPQNGNLGMQNQQAMQPQPMTPQAPIAAPLQAPAAQPQQVPATPPAPTPAQTALAQANASMAKGGKVDDLQVQANTLTRPADGPSAQDLQDMLADAQRRETRNWDNSINQSADDNYAANLQRWYAKQAADREAFMKESANLEQSNQAVNTERTARLSNYYTGNSNTNAGDLAMRYAPKTILNNTNFHGVQSQQAALGIANQTGGAMSFQNNPVAQQIVAAGTGGVAGAALYNGAKAMSDERSKEEIAPQSQIRDAGTNMRDSDLKTKDTAMNPKNFLDKLSAYSYEYKNQAKNDPNAGEGRYLSVMAQDLEKAGPVGQSMVKQDPSGVKQVDYGKGFGAILAAQVQLNERLKQIEAKKGKV